MGRMLFINFAAVLLAPWRVLAVLVLTAVYLLPSALAVHRNARHAPWIVAANLALGWTIIGWFAILGWAASAQSHESLPQPLPAGRQNAATAD